MATRVTLDRAPSPHKSMLLHLATLALAGALGGAAALWLFVVLPWWLIGFVIPAVSFENVAKYTGHSPDNPFGWWPFLFVSGPMAVVALWAGWREGQWRASHNRLGVQQMVRRLRYHRRKAGGAVTSRTRRGLALMLAGFVWPFALIALGRWAGEPFGAWLVRHTPLTTGWIVFLVFGVMIGLIAVGAAIGGSAVPLLRYWAARGSAFALEWATFAAFMLAIFSLVALGALLTVRPEPLPPYYVKSVLAGCLAIAAGSVWLAHRWVRTLRRRHARWLNDASLPNAREARAADRRRPVLYLRSFHDDHAWVVTEDTAHSDEKKGQRIEDLLAREVAAFGPVIAVGQPHTAVRSGAARAYFADGEWQAAVSGWVEEAQFVIIVAGFTAGVSWELERVLASGHATKLVVVFPPRDPRFAARWQWLQEHCRRHGAAFLPDTPVADAILVCLDRFSEALVLTSTEQHGGQYRAALTLALHEVYRL